MADPIEQPDYHENEWSVHMRSMLGKEVTVIIAREPKLIEVTGTLLMFDEGGEVALRHDDGFVGWSWPNLETKLADDD